MLKLIAARQLFCSVGFAICLSHLVWATPYCIATTITLDDFSSVSSNVIPPYAEQWPITVTSAITPAYIQGFEQTVGGVYGGVRGHMINRGNGSEVFQANNPVTFSINTTGGNSFLDYQSTAGGACKFSLYYGGVYNPSSFDLALPFTAGSFVLNFRDVSLPEGTSLNISSDAWQDFGNGHYSGFGATQSISVSGPQTITMPLQVVFAPTITHTDGFEVDIVPPNGASYQLDSISFIPVPEPNSFALLSMGAIGLALISRRRVLLRFAR
jgi:hypothetical protein